MTYDFHGSWESVTGIHSPLYSSPNDYTGLNQNASIHNWINAGASSKKILLGLAAYGRSFTLTNPNNNEIQASASGAGPAGVYSGEPGMLTYLEVKTKFFFLILFSPNFMVNEKKMICFRFVKRSIPEDIRNDI